MLGMVSLDQIRTGSEFDLTDIYGQNYDDDTNDSPFLYCNNSCTYFEPNEFQNMINHSKQSSSSYFHLNCRGLSSTGIHFIIFYLNYIRTRSHLILLESVNHFAHQAIYESSCQGITIVLLNLEIIVHGEV